MHPTAERLSVSVRGDLRWVIGNVRPQFFCGGAVGRLSVGSQGQVVQFRVSCKAMFTFTSPMRMESI